MPTYYRTVYNGGSLVRRKITTKAAKPAIVATLEPMIESAPAKTTVSQKALRAKLSAELFRSL